MQLRQYQTECLEKIASSALEGINRQLCVLATGSGKTVIASHMPKYLKPTKVLFLAHREELIDQAYETFKATYPALKVDKEIGQHYADPESHIIIGSVSTLGRQGSERLRNLFPDPDSLKVLVITDEAHHACGDTYKRVYDHFKLRDKDSRHIHIGITATPFRGDAESLTDIYEKITYTKKMGDLILEGYLCDLKSFRVQTNTDINKVAVQGGDYSVSQLSEAINTPERNNLIVSAYKQHVAPDKAIVFCADVQHASDVHKMFLEHGVPTGFVSGETPKEKRKEIVDGYKAGDLRVLTNCGVFIEGFDAADTRSVIMARPTKSPVLYTQIIGRGLRIFPGKENMLLIDMCDRTNIDSIHSDRILNAPTEKCTYRQWKELKQFINEINNSIDPEDLVRALNAYTKEEVQAKLESMDILEVISKIYDRGIDDFLKKNTNLFWTKSTDGSYNITAASLGKVAVRENALGTWELWHKAPREEWKIVESGTPKSCFKKGEKLIEDAQKTKLFTRTASWRSQPPTNEQLQFITRLLGRPIRTDVTSKGEAAFIINALIGSTRKKDSKRGPRRVRKVSQGDKSSSE